MTVKVNCGLPGAALDGLREVSVGALGGSTEKVRAFDPLTVILAVATAAIKFAGTCAVI